MLNIIDKFIRECLTIRIGRKLKAVDVIDTLSDLFILRGMPGHIRSDNGAIVDCRCRGHHGLHIACPRVRAQFNGKVERSYRTDEQEFHQPLIPTSAPNSFEWEHFYTLSRPHGAFNGKALRKSCAIGYKTGSGMSSHNRAAFE